MQGIKSISPREYAAQDQVVRATLIDVREPWEFSVAHIEGAQLKPLGQLREWAAALDKDTPYVIMCHHGGRSMMACQLLAQAGVKSVANLDGGINEWSLSVDPTIPRY